MSLEIGLNNIFFNKLLNIFFLSKLEKKLYIYFDIKKKVKKNKKILVECVEDYYYYSLFGMIVQSLDSKIDTEIYVARNLSVGASSSLLNFIKSLVFHNRFRDNKWIKLYRAYTNGIAYRHEGTTSIVLNIVLFVQAFKIYNKLHSKKDVLNLKFNDILVGDLIYDSYLRYKPAATVDTNDFYLCIVIWQSLRNIKMTQDYFVKNNIKFVLTSYSSYIHHGITARVAIHHGVDVYSFGDYGLFYQKLTSDYCYHAKDCRNYFKNYKKNEHNIHLHLATEGLANRLNGKIDMATSYMKESAYKNHSEDIPEVKNSVVIFLHDFFDSPHIYEKMLFCDFYEWFEKTIDILKENKIDFWIKPHPNQMEDSKIVVETLKIKYHNLKFLSTKITNKQLVDSGICAGISVYGTVAHELAYLGIPVVLCGDNPHSSYSFCFEAKNNQEYEIMLQGINSLTLPQDTKYQVESFYYMHNLNHSKEMIALLDDMSNLRGACVQLNEQSFIKYMDTTDEIMSNQEFKNLIKKLMKENR